MGSKGSRRRVVRRTQFETLEDRQMFSAEPLGGSIGHHAAPTADFWYDASLERDLDSLLGDVEQTLASAHELTGVTSARNNYGFVGAGQTVAVIDSGIAWDHPNLGAGFGATSRVVGGWDFTEENDANPYDDGTAGSHGTHVAGIVGATANATGDSGVAPGVDLVGLRVFNDQGDGYFSWVEKALRWVHTNRNAFANPITAVNLSLGTAYNAATVPSWATLEDEFAQLKADGIFIAVSAGNSFSTYKTAGLSYPAASPSVVPVMSVDDSGSLSYFSQRHSRAIAAPGRSIRSTVPDYVGNQNGVTDDWANYSGTSMASPYVAGASVLVREAMQVVGMTDITEDTIYNHMMSTADQVFDAATNQYFKRLNVAAALDALVPDDEFGSTAATAHDLGTVDTTGATVSGLINTLSDADFFRFTAAGTGTVTFTADTTHTLAAVWTGDGVVESDGNLYTLQVVAGQSYTVGLSSSGGIGYFDLTVTAESAFTFVDWGMVSQSQQTGIAVDGQSWYSITAQQAGYLTAEAFFADSGCNVELAWFDANLCEVASGVAGTNCERVDQLVSAGEQLYLRVRGTSDSVDFRLTNLVTLDGTTLTVAGTDGDDAISFVAGATNRLVVNGSSYEFSAAEASTIHILGGAGRDSISLTGTDATETVTLRGDAAEFIGQEVAVHVQGVESIDVYASGGVDSVVFYDTQADDTFYAYAASAQMVFASGQFENRAFGFDRVDAYATAGGLNRAFFYDSEGDDVFTVRPRSATMIGPGFANSAYGFEANYAFATSGGLDRAIFYDSSGDDQFVVRPHWSRMTGAGFNNSAEGFEANYAYATSGGLDRAIFYDSAGDDRFDVRPNWSRMYGADFNISAEGFDANYAYATAGGMDRAVFYDSAGDDRFEARPDWSRMWGDGFNISAQGFDASYAYASAGGLDRAYFYDSAGDDRFESSPTSSRLWGNSFNLYAEGFGANYAYSQSGGIDLACLYDSAGNDRFESRSDGARLSGGGFNSLASGFNGVQAISSGGVDEAIFDAIGALDEFSVREATASLRRGGLEAEALGFGSVTARALDGESPSAELNAIDCALALVGGWR
jgi:subtilisin family serine protease